MNELPLVLLVLAVVLGLIMLVGHGLWLLLAALFRLAAGESEPRRDSVRCAFCGSLVAAGAARCHWCNHRVRRPPEEELTDLEAVQRQLGRWRESGKLKPRTVDRLSGRLAQYRRERFATPLDGQAAAAETAPQPTRPAPTAAPPVRREAERPVPARWVAAELVQETPAQAPAPQPAEPARPWQEAVAGFLADRDIHWAELIGVVVGGFIMVGSSLALVVNLWQTLEQVPYLKFFVFVVYTSVVFAAGLYAFHRWKLRSTGGGLLVIGMLLVPLDFLAMASLWRAGLGHGAILAEIAGLAIFLVLIRLAAAAMTPHGRWFPPLAIVGNSAALLGIARFVQPGRPDWFPALAAGVPVAVFAGAMGGYLLWAGRKAVLRPSEAAALLIVLGTAGFALCVAVGLYVNQAAASLGSLTAALNLLAAPMALAAVPVLAVGVRLTRVVPAGADDETTAETEGAASFAAAGTLVALAAVLLQIAALGLAWPEPSALVVVGLLNAAGLLLVALRNRFPLAHAGAMACAGLSYLVGFHWLIGNLAGIAPEALDAELLKLAVSAQSGTAMGGLFVAFALASLLLKRMPERRHGEMYAAGSVVVAVIGLVLVTFHGSEAGGADALRAAALYSVYGVGSLALAALWRDRQFAYMGIPLLAAAPLWALWASTGELAPVAATLLAGEALLAAVVAFALGRGRSRFSPSLPNVFRHPLAHVAEVLAVLAAGLWVATAWTHRAAIDHALPPVATTAVLAVFYFAGAWMHRTGWRVRVPRGLSRFSRHKGQFAQSTIRKRRENGTVPLATIWRTWAGSLVVLAGLAHTLALNFTGTVEHPWLIAPLGHATAGLLAAVALDGVGRWRARLGRRLTPVFANPLAWSALFSSVLLLLVLPHLWQTTWTFAGGLFWLAALWLVFAVRSGNRFVFGAHQAMLAAAAVAAVTVRLDAMLPDLAEQWFKPAQLQLYGIALVAVLLPWPVLRVLGRGKRHVGWVVSDVSASGFPHAPSGSAPRNGRADSCEAPGGPSQKTGPVPSSPQTGYLRNWSGLLGMAPGVDHVLRHVLVALQFLLAAIWLAPELARELGLPAGPMAEGVHDVGAAGGWLLVGLLAAGLIVELWHRWGRAELAAALVLAGTVPWLLAGRAIDQVAAASALRWTAAGLFLGASALVWWRDGLGRLARMRGRRDRGKRDRSDLCEAPEGPSRQIGPVPFSSSDLCEAPGGPSRQIGPVPFSPVHVAQAGLLVFGLLPVVVPTILAVALRFDYVTPRGPLAESRFFAIGRNANNLVPLALVAATLVGWAIRERSAGYALGSILLANLVGLVAWQAWGPAGLDGLLPAQVFAMAGAAIFWTAMKRLLPDRTPPLPMGDAAPNHVAALAGVGFILLLAAAGALGAISGEYRLVVDRLEAFAWLAAAAATAFCLLDPTARFPIAALYFLGLAAVCFGLNYRDFGPREYAWTSAPELAGAMLAAGVIGWLFARLRAKIAEPPIKAASDSADTAAAPQPGAESSRLHAIVARLSDAASFPADWFPTCQAVLGAAAASLALWISFDVQNDGVGLGTAVFGLAGRWAGPPTALMLLGAVITMAWQAAGRRPRASDRGSRRLWQMAAFGVGFLLNLTIGLAALDATPGTALGEALWLNRCAVLLVGAAMLTLLSRFGLKGALPRSGDWLDVGRELSPVFAALTALTLPILLVLEVDAFEPTAGAPVARFSVVAIAVLLVLLAAACLSHALRAGRAAGARGFARPRQPVPTLFVYAAEAIVAMAALHVWLCEPQWLRLGFVEQYWMFLVMAVAFAGVGVSEWFDRAGVPVLSEPLRNTAVVLPVVPMTGFWFMAPPDSLLGLTGSTPALWLLMALFYGYLAAMKPTSILYGALTLLTASVGLWVLLDRQQLDFFTRPQLWLIPPALAMLIAERVNRPRLGRRQREALRYLGLSVIYVASTTEFMRGVGDSIWLPLVLLGLSVAGVLAGVALRIRSYIYLGMTFLAVVIVRMIVYAAFEQGQMWLFWVCCILLGAAIIVLFAVFERRRNDLAAAVEKFRQWEG